MAVAKSKIEWTEASWNPTVGCTLVSPGCDRCYAKAITERFQGPGAFDTVVLHPERLDQPERWQRPRLIFVDSMSDLFHTSVPDEFIARVFARMALTPWHVYQLLTKRHARLRSLLGDDGFRDEVAHEVVALAAGPGGVTLPAYLTDLDDWWPLPHVWIGVSVEDQHWAEIRIPALLETPAAVHFLSCEPLLGPLDLDRWLLRWACSACGHRVADPAPLDFTCPRCHATVGGFGDEYGLVDWLIVGGESGRGARPLHPQWARSLRDQCAASTGTAFFFKQWGEWTADKPSPIPARHTYGPDLIGLDGQPRTAEQADEPGVAQMWMVGKKRAGRRLDGELHQAFPDVPMPGHATPAAAATGRAASA